MKISLKVTIPLLAIAIWITASGCASSGGKDTAAGAGKSKSGSSQMKEAVLNHEDVRDKEPLVFEQPIQNVRPAAQRALVFVGCKLEKQEDYYISGERPRKFGLIVGSGGEKVEVFLYPSATNQTKVWIDTDLSFVGIVGQQDWSDKVASEMKTILNPANK